MTNAFKSKFAINKEPNMKKTLLVSVLVVALTFAFAATALAEHAPSNYSTVVRHHRRQRRRGAHAPHGLLDDHRQVQRVPLGPPLGGRRHADPQPGRRRTGSPPRRTRTRRCCSVRASPTRAATATSTPPSAASACGTATPPTAVRASAFTGGYGHEDMSCAECHAVHGAETFKGAAAGKILKYTTQNFLRVEHRLADVLRRPA